MSVPRPLRPVLVWVLRVTWLAHLVGIPLFGAALSDRSRPVQLTAATGLWLGWAAVATALLVPSTVSLTTVRLVVPAAPVVAAWALVAGADAALGGLAVALGLLATVLAMSGDVGEVFVQASAYGDERRFPLRPPGLMLPVVAAAWVAMAGTVMAGPLLLAATAWGAGVVVSALAGVLVATLPRRFHRLSRRWLVKVPAGLVLHDHVVLAETARFPMRQVRSLTLALADTRATDLTGGALGPAIEVTLTDPATVVLAPTRSHPGGLPLQVRSMLISPTRPGRTLAAFQRR